MVFSHTGVPDRVRRRPFSPSQTTISTSLVPRFLISAQTRSQYLAPYAVAVLPGPQAQDVALS